MQTQIADLNTTPVLADTTGPAVEMIAPGEVLVNTNRLKTAGTKVAVVTAGGVVALAVAYGLGKGALKVGRKVTSMLKDRKVKTAVADTKESARDAVESATEVLAAAAQA